MRTDPDAQAMQQALEALEKPNAGLVPHNGEWKSIQSIAIAALRTQLAAPEAVPAAYVVTHPVLREPRLEWTKPAADRVVCKPLYESPPSVNQAELVRLGLEAAAKNCEELSYPIEITEWERMTKKQHGAYACVQCAAAIRAIDPADVLAKREATK